MKQLLTLFVVSLSFSSMAQEGKNYLYLKNVTTGKIKRLNLDHTSYMYLNLASDAEPSYMETFTTYEPIKSVFGDDKISLNFTEYATYEDSYHNGKVTYSESHVYLEKDSTLDFTYGNNTAFPEMFLTQQTKFRSFLYNVGTGIFVASLFNAVIVSPFIGMNNGSFNNYSWSRFWRYELYSAIGLGISLPICVGFLEREFYLQTQSSYFQVWQVVEE